ncbi:hypothetical protein Pyn_12509 [Prunus yedoensis var. nudiflora]|uniref:Uncharacterized protein n=1 Tax=Prunus yedoensis var. nudiflora TaxID=2094558 RepID=A0A314Y4L2_PRUYE|nr:hypothetical protein Pyn_12509 [Prunus yedoensis var. nudiflora]
MYLILSDAKDGQPYLNGNVRSSLDFLAQHHPYNKVKVDDLKIPRARAGSQGQKTQKFCFKHCTATGPCFFAAQSYTEALREFVNLAER